MCQRRLHKVGGTKPGPGGTGGRCSRKEEEKSKTEVGIGIHRPYLDLTNTHKPIFLEQQTPVPKTKAPVSKGLREYLHDLVWANVWHALSPQVLSSMIFIFLTGRLSEITLIKTEIQS